MLRRIRLSGKGRKRLYQVLLIVFFVLNLLAYTGAYALTHFSSPGHFSIGLPRPNSAKRPIDVGLEYTTQRIAINQSEWLETWLIPVQTSPSQGTVLLFPGNGGSKAKQLLAPAQIFHALGYDTLLIDFRGVGGSSGHTTTLGAREAKDVAIALHYGQRLNLKQPIALYGVSMGTAAILKAIAQEGIQPAAIILELPFARLLDAVKSRLRAFHVPTFPLAELLVFWGSVQHQFNGFTHNPVMYATQVKCPTLVLQGERDRWTSASEINQLVQNLHGFKKLVIFPTAGHDLLVTVDQSLWKQSVEKFLEEIKSPYSIY